MSVPQNCKCCGIKVTKERFLYLAAHSLLKSCTTYNITDIDGFTEVFINTTSANTFDLSSSGTLLVPDYIASGSNLGQMDGNDIPTITVGEKVIWGDYYWINNTGSPITPTIVDNTTLDGGLSKISPKTVSDYDIILVDVILSDNLFPTKITNPKNNTFFELSANYLESLGFAAYTISQFNYQKIDGSNLTGATNFKLLQDNLYITLSENKIPLSNTIDSNTASFQNLIIKGINNTVTNNKSSNSGRFDGIELYNSCELSGNNASGNKDSNNLDCEQSFIELFDYCRYKNNITSGDGSYIYDVRTGENSEISNNNISGISSGINDIDQMYGDSIHANTISGNGSGMSQLWQNGYSKFDSNTITGNNSGMINIYQELGYMTGCSISSNNKFIQRITLENSWLKNATDIAISDFKLNGKTNTWNLTSPPSPTFIIDLTGFTTDINGETIEAGKGWFTITHDFGISPLTSGNNILYNLIPNGARLTSCTIIPNSLTGGIGATLRIGLETDDVNYGIAATALGSITNTVVNTVSNVATANRSLQLTAGVADITGGNVVVKVEFVI